MRDPANDQLTDGGPTATPELPGGVAGPEYGNHAGEPMQEGMTDRAVIATMMMHALVSDDVIRGEHSPRELAYDAVAYADALLAELEKPCNAGE